MADIAAQLATQIIADHEVDRTAFGLRLQRQLTLRLLQQRAEKRGQRQRLGKQLFDDRRIIVAGEDGVEHRSQPRDSAACIARRDRDADCGVRVELY